MICRPPSAESALSIHTIASDAPGAFRNIAVASIMPPTMNTYGHSR